MEMSGFSGFEVSYVAAMSLRRFRPGTEAMIVAALSSATFVYIYSWPQLLGTADEAHFLYQSREILAGRVPYRDLFEFYTPLSFFLMAGAFALFGVKLATAKVFMALVHALTVGLVFKAGRRVGVRRSLAGAASILYLVIGPSAWPYASPHWIAACLLVALLFVLTKRPLEKKSLVWLGLLTGLLTATQQQVGVPIAIGIGLVLIAESLLDRRAGQSTSVRELTQRVGMFAATAVGTTSAVLLTVMISAGPMPLFEQLVLHPLTGYRSNIQADWGVVGGLTQWLAFYTLPALLRVLSPGLLAISLLRLVIASRAPLPSAFGNLPAQTIHLFFCVCSVLYYPDFIHLAFISSVVLVVGAETMEWALARLEAMTSVPRLGALVSLTLVLLSIARLSATRVDLHDKFHLAHETAFGWVDFQSEKHRQFFLDVSSELDQSRERSLFCYPVYTSLYLTTGAHNPTRHVVMRPKYLSTAAYDEAIRTLDAERVQTLVLSPVFLDIDSDPMYAYVMRNYHCANASSNCLLYRRND